MTVYLISAGFSAKYPSSTTSPAGITKLLFEIVASDVVQPVKVYPSRDGTVATPTELSAAYSDSAGRAGAFSGTVPVYI